MPESTPTPEQPLVGIIMGSRSDWETMQHASEMLTQLGVPHEVEVVSAHRTPDKLFDYAEAAEPRGLEVIIAGAGGAAHLPGMVAALTPLPVIGVPVPTPALQGIDALLSIVQMPKGIPVATVAIGNAWNAGLLAVQMLASGDPQLRQRLQAYRRDLAEQVREKEALLQQVGWAHYPLP